MAKAKGKKKAPAVARLKAPKAVKPHRAPKRKGAIAFEIENADCSMGKFSNGLEKHGDEDVPAFTLTIGGVPFTKDQVDKYFGPYTSTSWFSVEAATRFERPMDWWQKIPGNQIKVDDEFDVEDLQIFCGGKTLEFESVEHKSDPDKSTPAGHVSDIVFKPQPGGITLVSFHLTVRPTQSQRNPLIDGQKGHVKITLGDVRSSGDRSKQTDLPLVPQAPESEHSFAH